MSRIQKNQSPEHGRGGQPVADQHDRPQWLYRPRSNGSPLWHRTQWLERPRSNGSPLWHRICAGRCGGRTSSREARRQSCVETRQQLRLLTRNPALRHLERSSPPRVGRRAPELPRPDVRAGVAYLPVPSAFAAALFGAAFGAPLLCGIAFVAAQFWPSSLLALFPCA